MKDGKEILQSILHVHVQKKQVDAPHSLFHITYIAPCLWNNPILFLPVISVLFLYCLYISGLVSQDHRPFLAVCCCH